MMAMFEVENLIKLYFENEPNELEVCLDSLISLNRIFGTWKCEGIPLEWIASTKKSLEYIKSKATITTTLLDGHPNHKQLAAGIGKRGNPCSIHNVLCDAEVHRQSQEYLATVRLGNT